MALESAAYISDLDVNNPSGADAVMEGDDHIRLIKATLKNTFPNLTGPVTASEADLSQIVDTVITDFAKTILAADSLAEVASILQIAAGESVVSTETPNIYIASQMVAETGLTDGATISWDWQTQQNATVTLGGSRTFAAPTNLVAGKYAALRVVQDATGSRAITWNANYKGVTGVTPSTAANSVDWFLFRARSTTICELVGYRKNVGA